MRRVRIRLLVLVLGAILLASSAALAAPVLKVGEKGEAVRVLQELLKAQGLFTAVPDGNFGPYTEEAVVSRWDWARRGCRSGAGYMGSPYGSSIHCSS